MERENALKILRELHDKALFSERTALKIFIPELKKSEDERIRKRLIEFFKDWGKTKSHCWGISISDILAWLEKQGEQKLAWSKEDEKEYKYALKFVDNILNNCGNKKDYEHSKRCYNWLKSLKDKIKKEAV